MMNYHKIKWLMICLCAVLAFGGCGAGEGKPTQPNSTPDKMLTCSITVQNEAGTALDMITVEIYSDESKTDIIQQRVTNDEGTVTFNRKGTVDGCVAVLKNVPAGYKVADAYPLTGENTVLTLKAGALLTEEHLNSRALLSLGDAVPDFSVTTSDGTEFTLSETLANNDAVILNFWYMNCQPCKMEFPYLQEASEQFENVAVIALNPMDSDNAAIESFRQKNGYTFLMGKCDSRWGDMMNLPSYPTTVVIDRYGNISMVHNGSVDNTQLFLDMFGFFSADDYEQTFIRSHSQLPDYEP